MCVVVDDRQAGRPSNRVENGALHFAAAVVICLLEWVVVVVVNVVVVVIVIVHYDITQHSWTKTWRGSDQIFESTESTASFCSVLRSEHRQYTLVHAKHDGR